MKTNITNNPCPSTMPHANDPQEEDRSRSDIIACGVCGQYDFEDYMYYVETPNVFNKRQLPDDQWMHVCSDCMADINR